MRSPIPKGLHCPRSHTGCHNCCLLLYEWIALKTWTSSSKREGSAGMDTWNAPTVQSRQPLTYRLLEIVSLGGPRWLKSSWQRAIAKSGSSQLSTLMTETPGDLVWDLPCVQQARYLEGGQLLWILPLYLHVNQKSDDDDDDDDDDDGWLAILCPFQQYFSHIRWIGGWSWKTMCNGTPFTRAPDKRENWG